MNENKKHENKKHENDKYDGQNRDELLTRDLLGELDAEGSEKIEVWCQEDSEFAAKRDERREVIRLLRETAPAPQALDELSRARLRQAATPRTGPRSWLPGAVAAALLIGFVTYLSIPQTRFGLEKTRDPVASRENSNSAESLPNKESKKPVEKPALSLSEKTSAGSTGKQDDLKNTPSGVPMARGAEILSEVRAVADGALANNERWQPNPPKEVAPVLKLSGGNSAVLPQGTPVPDPGQFGGLTYGGRDSAGSLFVVGQSATAEKGKDKLGTSRDNILGRITKEAKPANQERQRGRVAAGEERLADGRISLGGEPEAEIEHQYYAGDIIDEDRSIIAGKGPSEAERIIAMLKSRPGETPDAMFFRFWGDNPFVNTENDRQSTFGLDVDTASRRLCGSYINQGQLPPKAAVRTEEFINATPIGIAAPQQDDLGINIEVAPSRFSQKAGTRLVRIGIRAREIPDALRKGLALTMVIDVSGSMEQGNRLELVKQSLLTLLTELDGRDSIAIVAFQSTARLVLAPTPATEIDTIAAALGTLSPGGSTNVQQGLELGYALALRHFKNGGNNHVALFSDGVANTGITDVDGLLKKTAESQALGIDLDSFGVGMGNHNDALLEQLADRGNGQCNYIDGLEHAVHLFRRNIAGLFQAVARDAKVQVEFNPENVARFRQIGYENRAIADSDFRNDSVDAGEVGSGQQVIALYEVEPADGSSGNLGTVRLRWQPGSGGEFLEREMAIPAFTTDKYETSGAHFRLSAAVAAFAEILRGSYWARTTSISEVAAEIDSLVSIDTRDDGRVKEFSQMVRKAEEIYAGEATWAPGDVERLVDELKRNRWMRALLENGDSNRQTARAEEVRQLADELRKQNDDLEKRLRKLLPG